jgi:hypothetical protein
MDDQAVTEGASASKIPASPAASAVTRTRLHSWVETPSVEPGETLQFDLVVHPVKPSKTRHYAFEVFSRSVEGDEAEFVKDEWYIEISGASGLRRYHPYLLVGSLAILVMLVTLWLVSMGVVG